ncbi:MAG TPA: PxxKW family cysteine-rich protein [Smithellaceae bacterium]|nr:PxxKW family cysteine-rich protein [Smithellaceae bacterium]
MSKKGCTFIGSSCAPIIDKCMECNKVFEYESGKYCKVYPDPKSKWMKGNCPTASHIKIEIKEAQKINPLKASKRASKKK